MNHYPAPIPVIVPQPPEVPAQAPFAPLPSTYPSQPSFLPPALPPPPPPPYLRGGEHHPQAPTTAPQHQNMNMNIHGASEPAKRFATLYGLGGQHASPEYFAALDLGLFRVYFSRKDGLGQGRGRLMADSMGVASGSVPLAATASVGRGRRVEGTVGRAKGGNHRGTGKGGEKRGRGGDGPVARHRAVENLRRSGT